MVSFLINQVGCILYSDTYTIHSCMIHCWSFHWLGFQTSLKNFWSVNFLLFASFALFRLNVGSGKCSINDENNYSKIEWLKKNDWIHNEGLMSTKNPKKFFFWFFFESNQKIDVSERLLVKVCRRLNDFCHTINSHNINWMKSWPYVEIIIILFVTFAIQTQKNRYKVRILPMTINKHTKTIHKDWRYGFSFYSFDMQFIFFFWNLNCFLLNTHVVFAI